MKPIKVTTVLYRIKGKQVIKKGIEISNRNKSTVRLIDCDSLTFVNQQELDYRVSQEYTDGNIIFDGRVK